MEDDILPLLEINHGDNEDEASGSESDESDDMMNEDMEEDEEERREQQQDEKDKAAGQDPKKQASRTMNYDPSLTGSHSYLGSDMEEVRGRTILDENSVVMMPLITLPGMILVPGQTIPLHIFHQHTVAMIKTAIDSNKTFGVVTYRISSTDYSQTVASIGTTAEIFSKKDDTDDSSGISTVRLKARGRQRFEIIEYKTQTAGGLMAKVKILPELVLPNAFEGSRPLSHCRYCCSPPCDEEDIKTAVDRQGHVLTSVSFRKKRKIDRFTSAYFTWWPPWVYKMYDQALLMERIKTELHNWNETIKPENLPQSGIELSFWVIQNLPMSDNQRLHLLSINNASQRFQYALSMLQKYSVLCCKECGGEIANKSDVFCMSVEGPLGAYVNPGGYVHETFTLHKAKNLNLLGGPSKEHSWFPGFAWTIVQCRNCSHHMGWKFTATKKNLTPQKFYGLCRSSIVPGISQTDEELEESL
ncbi:hypothetical protein CHS0354_029913 [Potamilus streckersoni]|uniref:Protein cereblon n=1 Tax=Potamilus streckersoni TaxID=2493646 RepID=A0AAE0RTI1_9BIVA|nr:hypothetical protein CHS0354_029913 [Potamilus streckersoni]